MAQEFESREKILSYVEDLKVLTGFRDTDCDTLRRYRDVALRWGPSIVKEFYDTLFSYPPTASVFRPGERARRERALGEWYGRLFEGECGEDFWLWQWYVGVVHIKRKIYNRYMLAMTSRLQQIFLEKALGELPRHEAVRLYTAFKRLTDVIAGIIAEGYHLTYIESLEAVAGINPVLAERMMRIHIERALEKYRRR